jgi:2-keto-4-pentenoate hydratase/2-oxohepta-3-ene-1,7-dioic acid hydratase in catechol pathway
VRICRFNDNRLGVVLGDEVADVSAVIDELPSLRWPLPHGDAFIAALPKLRARMTELAAVSARLPLSSLHLLSPVANPGKVIAAPVNYAKHIQESRQDAGINFGSDVSAIDRYALFLKASSSVVGAGEGIEIHHDDGRRTDHEVELALVIGQTARNVPQEQALQYVAGYFIGLDITIRGTEDRSFRKSLDTFTVLGPWLVTADEFGCPDAVELSLHVNQERRQQAMELAAEARAAAHRAEATEAALRQDLHASRREIAATVHELEVAKSLAASHAAEAEEARASLHNLSERNFDASER